MIARPSTTGAFLQSCVSPCELSEFYRDTNEVPLPLAFVLLELFLSGPSLSSSAATRSRPRARARVSIGSLDVGTRIAIVAPSQQW